MAEALIVDRAISDAIYRHESRDKLLTAVKQSGFQPIVANARDLVLRGITTADEVYRTIHTTD